MIFRRWDQHGKRTEIYNYVHSKESYYVRSDTNIDYGMNLCMVVKDLFK